jgi:acyl-CoA synthetase (AMP-forming)/AMP-acid ligase II
MPAALVEEELITWCKAHLAHFKAPKAVLIRTEVARSASGKPDYAWARSQFQVENE